MNPPYAIRRGSKGISPEGVLKIFWEQPEIAAEIVTPAQRELIPMFGRMLATPMKDRENSRWQFGHPVRFDDTLAPARPGEGGPERIIR